MYVCIKVSCAHFVTISRLFIFTYIYTYKYIQTNASDMLVTDDATGALLFVVERTVAYRFRVILWIFGYFTTTVATHLYIYTGR